jgi:hypothetical protein
VCWNLENDPAEFVFKLALEFIEKVLINLPISSEFERLLRGMFHDTYAESTSVRIPRIIYTLYREWGTEKTIPKMIQLYERLISIVGSNARINAHLNADLARFIMQLTDDLPTAGRYMIHACEILAEDRTLHHMLGSLYLTKLIKYPPSKLDEIFTLDLSGLKNLANFL